MYRLTSLMLFTSIILSCERSSVPTTWDSNEDLYMAARKAVLYQALNSPESARDLISELIKLDLYPPVDTVLKMIANPDDSIQKILDGLAKAYDNLEPVRKAENTIIDIWEGHDILPQVAEEKQNPWGSEQACLTDDENYRPFMSDFRLANPKSAIGTFVIMPSIRGSYNELYLFAQIFNGLGYNVFTIEPRFATVDTMNFNMRYLYLKVDGLRAIRYIRSNAEELGVNPDKMITLGGSKGNGIHSMAIDFFDKTPVEVFESYGLTPNNYEIDEIDKVPANVAAIVCNYGGAETVSNLERITESPVYSEENFSKGYRFPDVFIVIGNTDRISNLPDVMNTMVTYHSNEARLYDIAWEIHICDKAAHGYGAGTAGSAIPAFNIQHHDPLLNIRAMWRELDAFLQINLRK